MLRWKEKLSIIHSSENWPTGRPISIPRNNRHHNITRGRPFSLSLSFSLSQFSELWTDWLTYCVFVAGRVVFGLIISLTSNLWTNSQTAIHTTFLFFPIHFSKRPGREYQMNLNEFKWIGHIRPCKDVPNFKCHFFFATGFLYKFYFILGMYLYQSYVCGFFLCGLLWRSVSQWHTRRYEKLRYYPCPVMAGILFLFFFLHFIRSSFFLFFLVGRDGWKISRE
jgi:hypothetical protein